MAEKVAIQTQPFYLKKAKLKGYKSIKNAEVEFCDGLNIIIGKNASGKSNLLEFLFHLLSFKGEYNFNIKAELTLQGIEGLQINTSFFTKRIKNLSLTNNTGTALHNVIYNGKKIETSYNSPTPQPRDNIELSLSPSFIIYNIPDPKSTPIIDAPFRFTFNQYFKSKEIAENLTKYSHKLLYFILNTCVRNVTKHFKNLNLDTLKDDIESEIDEKLKELSSLLVGLVPIDNIRLNSNFNIHFDKDSDNFTFSNFFLEYKIGDNWMLYSHLSDGTKRLFYIVSDLFVGTRDERGEEVRFTHLKNENHHRSIFLFEEPELGIHPHQLHQLMSFIKEQSEEKQIILSTHSPMVLDVLGKDDLHRIIIASNDDPKKGSQFRHLTEEEKDKAKLYMKDYFLSDYWKHSDLER